jgi:two-component system, sensor histidine kinase and response regulator
LGATPNHHLSRPTLLIVDDEEGPRESLRVVFKERFSCVVARCGKEGIDCAEQNDIDVAIIDIKMPDLSGTEVLRRIKNIDPTTECILLTGYETLETAREAVRYGASEYLTKPFDVFAIRSLADACLFRRRQKQAAHKSLENLRIINEDLTRELVRSERAIVAGLMGAGVIHQLGHPLSIIAGYSELLKEDLAGIENRSDLPAGQIVEKLALVLEEVERCKEIATRLLAFGRKSEGFAAVVDVNGLVADGTALIKAHPDAREADVTCSSHERGLAVLAWPTEMLQALINIGINGLQARQGKRAALHVSARSAAVVPAKCVYRSESATLGLPHVEISVKDNGCGIPRDDYQRILEPYFTTKPAGSGLGLAIAREIIGRHRGLIDVESVKDEGTTIRVYLPRVLAAVDDGS